MATVSGKGTSRALWRKSSYSGNGNNCVEVATWRKASYSNNGGNCVEAGASEVLVRDTTNREGGTLNFPASAWRAFAKDLKH